MDISTLKSGAKNLTGQGHTPADDPNQINYAEVASEEEQEAPGVNWGENIEDKAEWSSQEALGEKTVSIT